VSGDALRAGLAATTARPALVGWLVLTGLFQRLLVALALSVVVRRLAGHLLERPLAGSGSGTGTGEMLERTATVAAEVLAAGLEQPGKLLAGVGLLLLVVLLGEALGAIALAAGLAGIVGGGRGPRLVGVALARGPALWLIQLLDGGILLAGLGVGLGAALLGTGVGLTLGRMSGALLFALIAGPATAVMVLAWMALRAASLGVALGHPLGPALLEGIAFVRHHTGALLSLGASLSLRLFPLAVAALMVGSLVTRAAGPLAWLVVSLANALSTLWAYAALGALGRALSEPDGSDGTLPPAAG
jgi:hypothetical protein